MQTRFTHALLWSQSQCALHVESIDQMLSANRQAYTEDRRMDYAPIFFGPEDECREAAAAVRETMRQRQERRGTHETTDFPHINPAALGAGQQVAGFEKAIH